MKKYIRPAVTTFEMESDGMLALSRVNGGVADESEVLNNQKDFENNFWDTNEEWEE